MPICNCEQAVVAYREASALMNAGADLRPGAEFDSIALLAQRRSEEGSRLAKRIAKMPALTFAGVRARASVVQAAMPVDHVISGWITIDWHKGVLDALLRDLSGREAYWPLRNLAGAGPPRNGRRL